MKLAINLVTHIIIMGFVMIMLYQHINEKYQPLYNNLKNSGFSESSFDNAMKVVSNNNIICDSIGIMDCQKPLGDFLMHYYFDDKFNINNLEISFYHSYQQPSKTDFSYYFENLLNTNRAMLSITIIYIFCFLISNIFYKNYSIIGSYIYIVLLIILYILLAIFLALTSYYGEYGFKNGATFYFTGSTDIIKCNNNFDCLLKMHKYDNSAIVTSVNNYYTGLDIVLILLPFLHLFILTKNIYDNYFELESPAYHNLDDVSVPEIN